jgi:uncharacterized protein (TIGR00251 family)
MKGLQTLAIRETAGGAVVPVKAVPGSSRDRIVGVLGDRLKIATSAPAEKGKANAAIAAILAKALQVPPRVVVLLSGLTNPRKEFQIVGLSAQEIRQRLGGI